MYPAPEAPRRMTLWASVESAAGRSRDMLFRPFDLTKWFCLGVIIFIAQLAGGGGGGGGGGGNVSRLGRNGGHGGPHNPAEAFQTMEAWVWAHLGVILAVGLAISLVILAITLLVLYLGSRGQLMLARAVIMDDARIGVNWTAAGSRTMSLFLFWVVLGAVMLIFTLGLLAVAYLSIRGLAFAGTSGLWPYIGAALPFILILVFASLTATVFSVLVRNFVVPIMVWRDLPFTEGWSEFRERARGNVLVLLGFLGLKFVFGLAFGIGALLLGCLTCCMGFLPVLHQTLFAPYYIFDRAFGLYMLNGAWPEVYPIQPVVPVAAPVEPAAP